MVKRTRTRIQVGRERVTNLSNLSFKTFSLINCKRHVGSDQRTWKKMTKTFFSVNCPVWGSLIWVLIWLCFMNKLPRVALKRIFSKAGNRERAITPLTELFEISLQQGSHSTYPNLINLFSSERK